MKVVLSIFLCVLLICPCAIKLGVISWWQNNHAFIVSEQCENRFDVTVMCSGRCVLVREINKFDNQDQESNHSPLVNIMKMGVDVFEFQPIAPINTSFTENRNKLIPAYSQKHHGASICEAPVKPPIV